MLSLRLAPKVVGEDESCVLVEQASTGLGRLSELFMEICSGGHENHQPSSSGNTANSKKCFTFTKFSSTNEVSGLIRSTCSSSLVYTMKSQ